MITLEEQFKRTFELLIESKLTFALAGGLAASIYRDEDRLTKDIDFIVGGSGDLAEIGKQLIEQLGLSAYTLRKADLDGGPLFAIKKKILPK